MSAKELRSGTAHFLVDTGAEINIIKLKSLNENVRVSLDDSAVVTGITPERLETIGTTIITLHNSPVKFHVVKSTFPLKNDGILGQEYLRQEQAEISFAHNTLVTRSDPVKPFRFIDDNSIEQTTKRRNLKSRLYAIKARTRQPIAIDVINSNLKEGYLPRIGNIHGLYIGEAAVSVNDCGVCHVLAINTLGKDAVIEIPPQQLIPFEYHNFPEEQEYFDSDSNDRISTGVTDRVNEIINRLRLDHLNNEEKEHVIELIEEFPERFHLPSDKLQATPFITHNIPTVDDIPINTRQYRFPPIHKQEIEKQILTKLSDGIITPSTSPYNSPLWIVPKKPDSKGNPRWRMVIDFRKLNEKTIGDAYPLPNISEILDHLGEAQYFSTFDLASGFQQIEMNPKDRHKTAFTTPNGHYEYVRMPEGLKNAPATFQRLMDQVLRGLQGIEVFVYLDDIVVYAKNLDEHKKKIRRLFMRLADAGLSLQPDKCEFLKTEVAYLGHVIGKNGLRPDPKKITAVKNFPRPKNSKNIRQFLGLVGYYRRFIKNFAEKSKPLSDLLKKNAQFVWGKEQKKSFLELRKALCRSPILQYPNFDKPFTLTTDASDYAIGAILSQEVNGFDLPVAYLSRILTKPEQNYFTTEKECLAVLYAILHFRPYLYGRKFTLVSDHEPLRWIDSIKDPGQRLVRWRLKLRDYDYNFVHKSGKLNTNADALSRNPVIVNEIISSDDFTLSTTSDEENEIASEVISQKLFPLSRLKLTETPSSKQFPKAIDKKQEITRTRKRRPIILDPNAVATRTRSKIQTGSSSLKPSPTVLRPTHSEHTFDNITDDSDSTDDETSDIPKFRQRRSVLPNLEFHSESRMVGNPKIPENRETPSAFNETRQGSQNLQRHEDKIIELPEIYSSDSNSDDESFKTPNKSRHDFSENSSDEDTTIDQTQILREMDTHSDLENLTLQQRLEQLMNHTDTTLTEENLKATELQSTLPLGSSTPNVRRNKNPKEGGKNAHKQSSLGIQITENISPEVESNTPNLPKDLQDKVLKTITFSREHLTYYRSHYVHFISSDCHLVTPVSKLLSDLGIINTEILQDSKPKLGQILITKRGKYNIFSIVIKRNYFDELSQDTLRSGLEDLKETLLRLNINSFRMSYFGDLIDTLSQGTLVEMLADIFGDSSIKIVLCRGNVHVPPENFRPKIIAELHNSLIGGHKGVTKTYRRIRERFYWPNLRNDVQNFIRTCSSCQNQKLVRVKTREPMLITDTPLEPFSKVSLDTVGPLPVTPSGNKHILTMQDDLTKYCIAIPLPNIKSETIAHALVTHLILQYGTPRAILTDRGTSFLNKIIQHLAKIFKIQHVTTSGYRPQTNGALERSHIVLTEYISHYLNKFDDWDRLIPFAMFAYNTSIHEATNFTPFELIFGKIARCPSSFSTEDKLPTYNSYLHDLIIRLTEMQTIAGQNLIQAKEKSKFYYDRKACPFNGKIGDLAYVIVEPRKGKFSKRYHGPYRIVGILEKNNIILEDENGKRFAKHFDKLKLY
ncbi:Retrovirus-related Pol polyprotein from transposon 17.6 [Anthophora quadrimaculata]